MNYKKLLTLRTLTTLIILLISTNCLWGSLEEKNKIYSKYIFDEQRIIQSLSSQSERIKTLIQTVNIWEQDVDGGNTYGAIGQIQSRADKFVVERKTRKNLEKETLAFLELFTKLVDIRSKIEETKKVISSEKEKDEKKSMTIAIPKPIDSEKSSLDSFEYYEIKETLNVKQISALPDVYGDAGYWRILYNANIDKLKDPSDVLPVGTVLMVPNLNITREFEF